MLTITEIITTARAEGTATFAASDGQVFLHPDSPGWWRITIRGHQRDERITITDGRLDPLLRRWGYEGKWPHN